jgi:phage tail sheath protein FI
MPEYLAPGVFVEEVSFRSKSIEGVPTSTTGFVGMAHYGPVCYTEAPGKNPKGPKSCSPRLITSFVEFERVYGSLTPLSAGDSTATEEDRLPYLAHAARAFFDNGGKRLYVARVFAPRNTPATPLVFDEWGLARRAIAIPTAGVSATWRARWPGRAGNVRVLTQVVRSKNIAVPSGATAIVPRARPGMVVEVYAANPPVGNAPLVPGNLRVARANAMGAIELVNNAGATPPLNPTDIVQLVELSVEVTVNSERVDRYGELAGSPLQKRDVARILQKDDPEDEDAVVFLEYDAAAAAAGLGAAGDFAPAALMMALQGDTNGFLSGGHDGAIATPDDYAGQEADPDDVDKRATGLAALGEIDDIAIVAAPDGGGFDAAVAQQVADRLIGHAERLRYRIAIVDAPAGSSMTEIRDFRGMFDSSYGALYHPFIEIFDPTERAAQGAPPRRLVLPPSGFVAGIYARTDITRGVHKAPANEVVRGLTRFESNINKPRQEVLNPEGINALRFFEGRGYRVWGARTMSSDPEWKYVNVRRLFIYLEHSIDKGTQWAVFEPNNRRLWDNVRRTVEDFLLGLWKDGALLGDKPENAYFVRCDRTTMTQNDIDNGRMICLIGVAPVKPAEFVIFRIGQWTGDAKV